ncbi:hypothetical protein TKK_0006367 [Trichogramma kaykai]
MWGLLAASGLVQKYTCKDDGGTSTSTGLHHRWTRTKEDFIIEVAAAATQGDLQGLHHRWTRTKEDFIIGGPGPRRTSSSGDQDQGGLHHRGTRTKEDFIIGGPGPRRISG